MDTNPYEPPQQPQAMPKGRAWKWICLVGLAAMIVSGLVLLGTAEFRHGAVVYWNAPVAVLFAGMFACGGVTFMGGGIGWLIALMRTARQA